MLAVDELAPHIGLKRACQAFALNVASCIAIVIGTR
jgi:hypothetical protein